MSDGDKSTNTGGSSFWSTLPGILTGLAGVIGAITALIVGLKEANLIGQTPAPPEPAPSQPESEPSQPVEAVAVDDIPFGDDEEFALDFQFYSESPEYKSMFVSADDQGLLGYGWAEGEASQEAADAAAQADCQDDLLEIGVEAACEIYAIGDEIVW
ncbi:MAG: hypothetical protein AAF609_09610 [Cyanobacteria bacterium P01_C01_bin.120]